MNSYSGQQRIWYQEQKKAKIIILCTWLSNNQRRHVLRGQLLYSVRWMQVSRADHSALDN